MKKPKNWLEQRLTILTEIRNDEPERDWSVREISEEMKKNELVRRFNPNYGKSTAHRDLALINKQLISKREELAEHYIHTQLEITDNLIEDLLDEYQAVDDNVYEDHESIVKAKTNLAKTILSIQKRQSAILPIDMPKKLLVDNNFRFDIEHFYQIQRSVDDLILLEDPAVIDGDFDS